MNYCSQLLKMSLITGFVEITKSKRFLRKTLKLFVHFICAAGFFYQTWAFLQMYLSYPTTQHTSEGYPEEFMGPALTICNNNRLFRQRLCTIYPENCEGENSTDEEFCKAHRLQCADWYYFDEFTKAFPYRFASYKQDRSSTLLNTVGPYKENDVVWSCSAFINGVDCRPRVIQAAKYGYPYNCFSLLSLLGRQNEEPFNVTYTDEYWIDLEMRPHEYIDDIDVAQAWIMFHDSRKKVNPLTEGLPLTAGYRYNLFPTMGSFVPIHSAVPIHPILRKKKLSLPAPYSTQCTDYLEEWKENGGYGPLSKKDCIDECKIEAMIEKNGCVGHDITYPNNYSICDDSAPSSAEFVQKCSTICREACEENTYSFTTEIVQEHVSGPPPREIFFKNRYLEIRVKFNRMMIKTSNHIQKFESIELFSYIGGYLGMWLGITLGSLYDVLKMVYDIVYLILERQRNRKKTTPIETF